jgi:hypothetical protein
VVEEKPAEVAQAAPPPLAPKHVAPPLDIPQTYEGKRISSKTQLIPNPDTEELEPIPPVLEAKAPPKEGEEVEPA